MTGGGSIVGGVVIAWVGCGLGPELKGVGRVWGSRGELWTVCRYVLREVVWLSLVCF